ncbi:MAG: ABC transporter permease [Bacteroidetes bacterium]|nr:MAG: ABC transporter permease [Bacteroidota bacterium]
MKFEFFIAKRLIRRPPDIDNSISQGVKPIIKISIATVVVGIIVMILTLTIVNGFQSEIRDKIISFGSHIQITSFDLNNSFETSPISKNQPFYPYLDTVKEVKHIQVFATKPGIIKTKTDIHGIVLKGIDTDFDWSNFQKNIIEGNPIKIQDDSVSNKVLISKTISEKLQLKTGDKFATYFIQKPPRVRKFEVAGIYETGLQKFDESFIICDIKHIQKLNNWSPDMVSGFEVAINSFDDLDNSDKIISKYIGFELKSETIKDKHQEIFSWLELQDWNVFIIIFLMTLVAGITMISTLLIIILEKTNMIGVLKALGATNLSVKRIFIINGGYLVLTGLIIGNALGLLLAFLQFQFHFISLPKESYYIDYVPVKFDFQELILLNIATFCACILMQIIPAHFITKISPVKAIRFE